MIMQVAHLTFGQPFLAGSEWKHLLLGVGAQYLPKRG